MQDASKIMFPKLTLQDIEDFEKTYRGSNDELRDLSGLIVRTKVIWTVSWMLHCARLRKRSRTSEPFFISLLTRRILHTFEAVTSATSSKRRKRNDDLERQEAEVLLSEIIVQVEEPWTPSQRRVAQFHSFIASMERKYCKTAPRAAPTQKMWAECILPAKGCLHLSRLIKWDRVFFFYSFFQIMCPQNHDRLIWSHELTLHWKFPLSQQLGLLLLLQSSTPDCCTFVSLWPYVVFVKLACVRQAFSP